MEAADVEVKTQGLVVTGNLSAIAIVTREDRVAVSRDVGAAKAWIKNAEAHFAKNIKKAFDLHKGLVAERNEVVDPVKAWVSERERSMLAFDRIEREKREREDRERRDAAFKREEEARLAAAIAREAEAERLRLLAKENATAGRLLSAAYLREEAKDIAEQADALLSAPIPEPIIVAAPVEKIEGETSRGTWTGIVTDLSALIRAAAADPRLERLLTVVPAQLNALARERQGENPPAGVKFDKKTTYAH